VASVIAQLGVDPLVLPYLPHLIIGAAAVAIVWRAPETCGGPARGAAGVAGPAGVAGAAGAARKWLPRAVRSRRFWLAVAPAAPWVFGSATLAFVVLPQEVTSAGHLSVGFAGLATTVSVAGGLAVQSLARRLEARRRLAGNVAGLACAVAASALAIVAVTTSSRAIALACAALFGSAYGLCLVSGLRESERLAGPREHAAVVACYYVLTYVGFGAAYLADGLNAVIGRTGTFVALAVAAALTAIWTAGYAAASGPASRAALPVPAGRNTPPLPQDPRQDQPRTGPPSSHSPHSYLAPLVRTVRQGAARQSRHTGQRVPETVDQAERRRGFRPRRQDDGSKAAGTS
jgi:hypothetical protein